MLLTLSLGSSIVDAGADCTGNGGSGIAYTIVVDKSGGGNFTSVQSAIDSIPSQNNRWIKVHINPGVYVEKVTIPKDKPCIFLEGQDRKVTTITFNQHDRTDTSTTFTSYAGNLFVKGRHYFSKCYIEGATDFIFGYGQSFYEDCSINVSASAFSPKYPYGYITAQGRQSSNDPGGFVFKGGVIFGAVRPYLGRAWGPYSRVIFQETKFNSDVIPQGWDAWSFRGKEGNFMYAEVNCTGPGSNASKRVSWEKKLSADQIKQFSLWSFVDYDGWISRLPWK
ncbi:hypothetical protein V6N12_015002 [Hibiscus sabdariffa]|uniref:Pectinesterase n=1 Tax=Hibiscus sabdariffa TaxID=183260 RepID=A0ABR2DN15_9ROSI